MGTRLYLLTISLVLSTYSDIPFSMIPSGCTYGRAPQMVYTYTLSLWGIQAGVPESLGLVHLP